MESDSGTSTPEPQLLSSPQSSHHSDPPVMESFTLTRDDIQVLEGYVDAFQEANADCWSGIIANMMAEIVTIRPVGEGFSKVDASKVRPISHRGCFSALI